jgi:hypothetical protein
VVGDSDDAELDVVSEDSASEDDGDDEGDAPADSLAFDEHPATTSTPAAAADTRNEPNFSDAITLGL